MKLKIPLILAMVVLSAAPMLAGGDKKKSERGMTRDDGIGTLRREAERFVGHRQPVGFSGHYPRKFKRKAMPGIYAPNRRNGVSHPAH